MQELKYREVAVSDENGRPLSMSYFVLVDKDKRPARYGVKILERNSGESSQAFDLTIDTKRIYTLVDKLAKHTVTPATLADVVADWL